MLLGKHGIKYLTTLGELTDWRLYWLVGRILGGQQGHAHKPGNTRDLTSVNEVVSAGWLLDLV